MNIYLVSRTDDWSYEDYVSFVCIANGAEEAQQLHPDGGSLTHYPTNIERGEYGCWPRDIKLIDVKLIGVANNDQQKGIVLSSFNRVEEGRELRVLNDEA